MTLQLQTAGVNVLRDKHYALNPATGLYGKSTLLEGQSTNLITRNAGFGASMVEWTNGGDPALVLSVVDDSAALAAAGLDKLVTDGKVIKIDNSAGTTTAHAQSTVTSTATAASAFAWVRGGAGAINQGGTLGFTSFAASSSYQKVVSRNFVAFGGVSAFSVNANAGQVVYLVLPQFEQLPVETSQIVTTGATVTRSADNASRDLPAGFTTPQAMTLYAKFVEMGTSLITSGAGVLAVGGSADASVFVLLTAGRYGVIHRRAVDVSALAGAAPGSVGQLTELCASVFDDGSVQMSQSLNGGAEAIGARSAANAFAATWATNTVYVGQRGSALNPGFAAFLSVKLARGVKSMAQMRAFP